MVSSRKLKALFIVGVLAATLAAAQAFADPRLQGSWLWDGPSHAGIIINGPNFVWIIEEAGGTFIGNFSVSGNVATFNVTHFVDELDGLWYAYNETWRYHFSFQTNNRLVINNWIYLRS